MGGGGLAVLRASRGRPDGVVTVACFVRLGSISRFRSPPRRSSERRSLPPIGAANGADGGGKEMAVACELDQLGTGSGEGEVGER